MLRKLMFVPALAVALAAPAFASTTDVQRAEQTVAQTQEKQALPDEVIRVESDAPRRSAVGIIVRDAAYGGLAGLAVGAGVALFNGGDNWGRDLMTGAGIGVLIGAVVGGIDAATSADGFASRRAAADPALNLGKTAGPQLGYGARF